jgi:Holliday junction resolvase-like predicted endonuclease
MILEDQKVEIPVELPNPAAIPDSPKQKNANYSPMFFNHLESLTPEEILKYAIICFVVIAIFSQFNIGLNIILGLLIAGAIVTFLVYSQNTLREGNFIHMELKMNSLIPVPEYFYCDVNIIETMFNMLEFYNYSPHEYSAAIEHIDNVLALELDTETGELINCGETIDVIVEEATMAIQELSYIQANLPANDILEEKLLRGIEVIDLYLQRHVDDARNNCKIKNIVYHGPRLPSKVTKHNEAFSDIDPDEIPYNKELKTPFLYNNSAKRTESVCHGAS